MRHKTKIQTRQMLKGYFLRGKDKGGAVREQIRVLGPPAHSPNAPLFPFVSRGRPFLPTIAKTQTSQLEDRLNLQERTIAFLLEQAFRIKEDISACLQGAHGFRKEEALARKLLESHIQTITNIVKKLSQNIEVVPVPNMLASLLDKDYQLPKSFFNYRNVLLLFKFK